MPVDTKPLRSLTVADLLARYRDTVTPTKKGASQETRRLNAMLGERWTSRPLSDTSATLFAAYRDERLKNVKPGTVRRDLALLQRVFEVARREWAIPLHLNPVADVCKPPAGRPRDRRLDDDDAAEVFAAIEQCRNPFVGPVVRLALETGMRRSEVLTAIWANVDLEARTMRLEQTKNGHPRVIPLSPKAVAILKALPRSGDPRVFPTSINAFRLAWQRVQNRSGIADLHFHDLRHEAISRFFERGLSVPEVALISGHRDPRMLFRYAHLRAEDVAAKL